MLQSSKKARKFRLRTPVETPLSSPGVWESVCLGICRKGKGNSKNSWPQICKSIRKLLKPESSIIVLHLQTTFHLTSLALLPKEKAEVSNFNSREIPQREKLAINYVHPRIRNRTLCRVPGTDRSISSGSPAGVPMRP